ncbi:hypothetical protein PV326_009409 [Microctonus aethiopoides]|nr:hypothetical protein PV326_009409 [Microctonus aethiopoides]
MAIPPRSKACDINSATKTHSVEPMCWTTSRDDCRTSHHQQNLILFKLKHMSATKFTPQNLTNIDRRFLKLNQNYENKRIIYDRITDIMADLEKSRNTSISAHSCSSGVQIDNEFSANKFLAQPTNNLEAQIIQQFTPVYKAYEV